VRLLPYLICHLCCMLIAVVIAFALPWSHCAIVPCQITPPHELDIICRSLAEYTHLPEHSFHARSVMKHDNALQCVPSLFPLPSHSYCIPYLLLLCSSFGLGGTRLGSSVHLAHGMYVHMSIWASVIVTLSIQNYSTLPSINRIFIPP
jgi:hypothetical protein